MRLTSTPGVTRANSLDADGNGEAAVKGGRLLKATVITFILLVVVWAISEYVEVDWSGWLYLLTQSPGYLAWIAIALAFTAVANGIVLRDLVASFGVRLRTSEWLGLTLVGTLVNMAVPFRGGAAMRAAYLKKYHQLPLAKYASCLAATAAVTIVVNAALAGILLVSLGVPGGVSGWIVVSTCGAISLSGVVALRMAPVFSFSTGIRGAIASAMRGWRTISRDVGLRRRLFAWIGLHTAAHAAAFVVAFKVSGWEGVVWVPLVSSAFAKIGGLLGLTPGGIGVYEAFGIVSATLIGGQAEIALLAIVLIRAVALGIALLGSVTVGLKVVGLLELRRTRSD